jgi:hypothetical protein
MRLKRQRCYALRRDKDDTTKHSRCHAAKIDDDFKFEKRASVFI